MASWHKKTPEDVLLELESNADSGLTAVEVARRQQQHGSNELVEMGGRGAFRILGEQFCSAMIVLLVVAALVSLYLEEFIDASAILAIIALNAALGFSQDYRAERALAALKRLAVPVVKVRRDGTLREVGAKELVPGDVVLLEVGNLVPADCRLFDSANLRIEEAALTGESEPVDKSDDAIESGELSLGDRVNMAYMGTLIARGHALSVVTETGMETELGHIAGSLQRVKRRPTPLQRRLAQLGRTLAVVALAIVGLVFGLGLLAGEAPRLMLMTGLSLAVAIVPEGLPAVATVALALGARRMFRREALIRKLPAVETLGSVTVICSDKTGTLTENRMTVTVLEVEGQRVEPPASRTADEIAVPESGSSPAAGDERVASSPSLTLLLAGARLCNDAELVHGASPRSFKAVGEPTEAALLLISARMGLSAPEMGEWFPRVDEVPFDSQRKRMTTVHRIETSPVDQDRAELEGPLSVLLDELTSAGHVAFMKGAVDSVLSTCRSVWIEGGARALSDEERGRIMESNDQLAADGLRVLGVALRSLGEAVPTGGLDEIEQEMVFVGMLGMIDPPRTEVKDAVARCCTAGIRPIMITGDHPLTALKIAGQLGISRDGGRVLVGHELTGMSVVDLEPLTDEVSVYARVAPKDKLHIVEALQNQGHVVAMTGDGVNDAPALKQAHIGVAMGQMGTDVSKEASDMVLLDDNFATIVNAVEEGRVVYDNIRKFVKYTMTSNAGEVWVMMLGPLLGMPLPLLPLQILWVNLVTDGLPGLALAVESAERNTMRRPPYPPGEPIIGRELWRDIAWVGLLMGAVSLAMGYLRWSEGNWEDAHWRTIVFTVLTLSQMGNALATRSSRDSLFRLGLLSNKALLGSVLLTFVLQMGVVYVPPLQAVFKTTALSAGELLSCLLLSTVVFWAVEAQKLLLRWRSSRQRTGPIA